MQQSNSTPNIEATLEGNISGQVIVGNNNIQILADHGGKVSVTVPGERTIPRPRSVPVSILPRRFSGLLDRQSEIGSAVSALQSTLPVEFYGEEGSGKTSLLRNIAHHPDANCLPDGIACVSAAGLDAGDLSQELFNVFYDVDDNSFKPTGIQFRHFMQDKKALILLDDVELMREEAERLMMALPGCAFVATSRERHLWGEGLSMAVAGLPTKEALELFERELGRSLTNDERRSAEILCADLNYNPMRVLRAAALAREQQRVVASSPGQVPGFAATKGLIDEVIAPLNESERQMMGALAALGGVSIHADHLAAIAGLANAQAVLDGLQRRSLVQVYESRYSLTSDLTEALQRTWELTPWKERALIYFTSWAEERQRAHKVVREEAIAIQAILKWAVKAGRWEETIRLAKATENALILGGRWDAWHQTLQWMLKAARALGRTAVIGFALHQLGTRALGLEQKPAAESYLREALNVRESLGDEAGAAITRHNLNLLLSPLPTQEPSQDPPQPPEASAFKPQSGARLLKWMSLAAALLLIGGLAIWFYVSGRNANKPGISSFTATPTSIIIGGQTKLCYGVVHASRARIEPSIGQVEVSESNCIQVEPKDTTTYILTAVNNSGQEVHQTITITVTKPEPTISFSADRKTIVSGESAVISYDVQYATSIRIEPEIKVTGPPFKGSFGVAPQQTTTYTLTVIGYDERPHTQQIAIEVKGSVDIISFAARPESVREGSEAQLCYNVTNARELQIEPKIGEITSLEHGCFTIPARETTYRLTATGYNNQQVNRTFTIKVVYLPKILRFDADRQQITSGEPVTLHYGMSQATSASITPRPGQVRLGENEFITDNPKQTTTYKLVATGAGGEQASQEVTVNVVEPPAPQIFAFTANPATVTEPQHVSLCYKVANASSLRLIPFDGRLQPTDGCVTVAPAKTTVYTLIAIGTGNRTDSKFLTVTVVPRKSPPRITFNARPARILAGKPTRLCYNITDAKTVSINQGIGEQRDPQQGCVTVVPKETITYTLTATNDGGSQTQDAIVTVYVPPDVDPPKPSGQEEDEPGWCCIQSRRFSQVFGSFSLAVQQPCPAIKATKKQCKGRAGKFYKTQKEACEVCRN